MNESLASQQVVNAKLRAGASDLRRAIDSTARRALDITLSLAGILLLAPVFALLALSLIHI